MRPTEVMMEFVGGPYDGFCQLLDEFDGDLAPDFELPVQQNLIRVMAGEKPRSAQKVRTVAVYLLVGVGPGVRYVFNGIRWATRTERPIFDNWCQQILDNWQKAGR